MGTFAVAAVAAIIIAAAGVFLWKAWDQGVVPPPNPSEKDTLVLAAIENTTGDPGFDEAIRHALAVGLGDSSFLSVMPDDTARAWLRSMGRPADTRLSGSVAREVCQKSGSKGVLETSIASIGTRYVFSLRGIDCLTGATVAYEAEGDTKEKVLDALASTTSAMRKKLDAVHIFALAFAAEKAEGSAAAIPLFRRVVELNPDDAQPHLALSHQYFHLDRRDEGLKEITQAYALRDRADAWLRILIESFYALHATRDLNAALEGFETLRRLDPRDVLGAGNAADVGLRLGRLEEAVRYNEEALKLSPDIADWQVNQATLLISLDRLDEASAVLSDAKRRGVPESIFREINYRLAFLEGDRATMDRIVTASLGRPGVEHIALSGEASTETLRGRLRRARELLRRAEDSAGRAGVPSAAARMRAVAALAEAELGGDARRCAEEARAVASSTGDPDVRGAAAVVLARAGEPSAALELAEALESELPAGTILHISVLPSIRGAAALAKGLPEEALRALDANLGYEMAEGIVPMYPVYLRGVANLLLKRGQAAAAEFGKIVSRRGFVGNSFVGPLARLGLIRALTLTGDNPRAAAEAKALLETWRDADPDFKPVADVRSIVERSLP